MVVSVCACGNDPGESNAVSKGTEKEAVGTNISTETQQEIVEDYVPTYPIVDEKITITGLVVGEDTSVSSTRVVWDEVEKLTNIHIEWENIDAEAFTTRLASGKWPDLIAHDMGVTSVYDYGVLGGKLVNYLDYIDIMPNLKKTFEDYPQTLAYATELDGAVYGLFRVSGAIATSTKARPHYLKNVLEKAGYTGELKTIDDFYNALVTCKEYYGTPSYFHFNNEGGWAPMLFAAFGTLTQVDFGDDGTGKVVACFATEQYKEYVKFLNKLYEEELMNREYLTIDSKSQVSLVQSGTYAFVPSSVATVVSEAELDGDWSNFATLAPLTSEFDDTQEIIGYPDFYTTHGMYINKDSQYIEEICKMLDICFASEEVVEGSNLYEIIKVLEGLPNLLRVFREGLPYFYNELLRGSREGLI